MTPEQVRKLYKEQGNRRHLRTLLSRKSEGKSNLALAKRYSKEGLTRYEAADKLGIDEDKLVDLLYRRTGSSKWPVKGHEPNDKA